MTNANLPFLQTCLLNIYKILSRTGVLKMKFGQVLFHTSYNLYKEIWEARSFNHLKNFATPGSAVIDVGANIGFFTHRFSRWVGPAGQVIAIEPEDLNFTRLLASGLKNVSAIKAAAWDDDGTVNLSLNPDHPGDHRIGDLGIPTRALTLDSLLDEKIAGPVSLIKIDVQGAEHRTLKGATNLIAAFHPTIFMEVDNAALAALDTNAEALFNMLCERGYTIHSINRGGISDEILLDDALKQAQEISYSDYLFIHESYPIKLERS